MAPETFSPRQSARMTGLLYLVVALTSPLTLFYIPSQTRVRGDAVATAEKMLANETLFRSGLALGIFTTVLFLVIAILLYRLFKPVNAHLARLMVVGVAIQIPIDFVLDTFSIGSLMILKGQALKEFAIDQRQSMAMLMLKLASYGTQLLQSLWGLWLLPLGMLVWKSGFMPRWLGIFVFLNGIAYILTSLAFMMAPALQDLVNQVTFPLLFGELAFMLWLVIKTVRIPEQSPTHKPEPNFS